MVQRIDRIKSAECLPKEMSALKESFLLIRLSKEWIWSHFHSLSFREKTHLSTPIRSTEAQLPTQVDVLQEGNMHVTLPATVFK